MVKAKCYRDMLKSELTFRKEKNRSYSLRAFARDLTISPAFLSQILQNKKHLDPNRAMHVVQKLAWAGNKANRFLRLVQAESFNDQNVKTEILDSITAEFANEEIPSHILPNDLFALISNWYHFAILELTCLKDFQSDVAWIAKRLTLTELEVSGAIRRLIRTKMLSVVDGKLVKTHGDYSTPDDIPADAIVDFHRSILRMATQKLASTELKDRDYGSVTFATSRAKLDKAKQMIRSFQMRLMNTLECDNPDTVYQFSTQFFQLDRTT